jgi:hypothetical protein
MGLGRPSEPRSLSPLISLSCVSLVSRLPSLSSAPPGPCALADFVAEAGLRDFVAEAEAQSLSLARSAQLFKTSTRPPRHRHCAATTHRVRHCRHRHCRHFEPLPASGFFRPRAVRVRRAPGPAGQPHAPRPTHCLWRTEIETGGAGRGRGLSQARQAPPRPRPKEEQGGPGASGGT